MSDIEIGNVYEMNKQLSNKEKILDPIMLNKKVSKVTNLICNNKYLMLLCHDQRDYTIFHICNHSAEKLSKELKETLLNRGQIVSIDRTEDSQAWEIWIRTNDNEDFCYYLFDYTSGIVEVK